MSEEIPFQKVIQYKKQGMDDNKIIDALINENYSYSQIRDAIQQAKIKSSISNPANPVQQSNNNQPTQPKAENKPTSIQNTPPTPKPVSQPVQNHNQEMPKPVMNNSSNNMNIDDIQRVLEEIIQEKWKESEKTITHLNEWKAVVNTKLKEFETRFSELNERINSMNNILGQKAEEFNGTMQNVDTEIKALEKALNKLVPSLSDNISELKTILEEKK